MAVFTSGGLRSGNTQADFEMVEVMMPRWQADKLRKYARKYRTSLPGMVGLICAFYFGDGKNHLRCGHCVYGTGETCALDAEEETQTTVPLLDKGTVVVGHPPIEQGKREKRRKAWKRTGKKMVELFEEQA